MLYFGRGDDSFFGDGLVVALFVKERRFGCAHEVLLGILKAFPNRQSSGLELLSCQWECKGQAREPFVLVPLVCEQFLVPLSLDPASARGKA